MAEVSHPVRVDRHSVPPFPDLKQLVKKEDFEMSEAAAWPVLARLLAGTAQAAAPILAARGAQLWRSAQTFLQQAYGGVAQKFAELSRSALSALTSKPYWFRFAKTGGISVAFRGGYDLSTGTEPQTMRRNAMLAFLGGGICGGLIPRIPLSASPWVNQWVAPALRRAIPYNYVGLDLLGDVSKNYLVDIRDKHGDRSGIAVAGGLLAVENGMAVLAFLPFEGGWGKAIKTALIGTGISIGMETFLQRNGGKPWSEIDPGRFVGMSAWGHSIVVLPLAIVGGAFKAVGFTPAIRQTAELGTKYFVFVNPSVNNFAAKINNQNWDNVQTGNTLRHAIAMWPARFVQAWFGPSRFISQAVDEGMGSLTIAGVNEVWPFYEGIPEIWSQGFLERVRAGASEAQYGSLTQYLSEEMGSFSLADRTYLPSPVNLEQTKKLMAAARDPLLRDRFSQYLRHLDKRGEKRTRQEQKIFEHFSHGTQVAWVF